jgi:probable rRNA maturation factor
MIVSIEVENESWPSLAEFEDVVRQAVASALVAANEDVSGCEVSLLFTDDAAIAELNAEWRGKGSPTNVLSFPTAEDMPLPEGEPRPLGDIVLAYGVISREAVEQGKTLRDHTAHLIVHGTLHLIGYDHETDDDAEEMERLETGILKGLGISNPYE